jgi:hypothetical protein
MLDISAAAYHLQQEMTGLLAEQPSKTQLLLLCRLCSTTSGQTVTKSNHGQSGKSK